MKSMAKFFIFTVLFLISSALFSQNNGTSKAYSFDIRKKIEPPLLAIEGLRFIDEDGNKAINANENCKIEFKLINTGKGDALNIKALVNATGNTEGISFLKSQNLFKVDKLGGSQTFLIEIKSDFKTTDGNIEFTLEIEEPNGFNTDKINIKVATRKFLAPSLKVVDCIVFSGNHASNLELKKPFSVQLLIQNVGQGQAKNAELKFNIPENLMMTDGETVMQLNDIAPNGTLSIIYELIANTKYKLPNIVLSAKLTESFNSYGENWTKTLALNQSLAQKQIQIEAKSENKINIVTASLRSDVDKDIPQNSIKYPKRYALIIGNEDYSSRQTGLSAEVNVAFAINDAITFKEYAINTFGIEEENCFLLTNATAGEMSQKIELISQILSRLGENGELIFYYAGHGFPDEKTTYLIPVDVSATNLQTAIKLTDIYNKFSQTKAKRISIFLDACFTGGGRDQGLIAARGVNRIPKQDIISGNMVVFTATSEEQSALPYKEKQHGIFTYFLLKKLQESKGEVTYGEIEKYLKEIISLESLKINNKAQDPKVNVSSDAQNIWSTWKIK